MGTPSTSPVRAAALRSTHPVAGPLSPPPAAASFPPPVGQSHLPGGQRRGKRRGWGLAATQPSMPCRTPCRAARPEPPAVLDNADGDRRPTGRVSLLRFHRSPAPPGRLSSLRGAAEAAGTAGSCGPAPCPAAGGGRTLLITLPVFRAAPRYAHPTGARRDATSTRGKAPVQALAALPGALSRSLSRSQIRDPSPGPCLDPCLDPRSQSR